MNWPWDLSFKKDSLTFIWLFRLIMFVGLLRIFLIWVIVWYWFADQFILFDMFVMLIPLYFSLHLQYLNHICTSLQIQCHLPLLLYSIRNFMVISLPILLFFVILFRIFMNLVIKFYQNSRSFWNKLTLNGVILEIWWTSKMVLVFCRVFSIFSVTFYTNLMISHLAHFVFLLSFLV